MGCVQEVTGPAPDFLLLPGWPHAGRRAPEAPGCLRWSPLGGSRGLPPGSMAYCPAHRAEMGSSAVQRTRAVLHPSWAFSKVSLTFRRLCLAGPLACPLVWCHSFPGDEPSGLRDGSRAAGEGVSGAPGVPCLPGHTWWGPRIAATLRSLSPPSSPPASCVRPAHHPEWLWGSEHKPLLS